MKSFTWFWLSGFFLGTSLGMCISANLSYASERQVLYRANGSLLGYIEGEVVKDSSNKILGYLRNNATYDASNRKIVNNKLPGVLFCGKI